MSEPEVTIRLTAPQIARVVQKASGGAELAIQLSGVEDLEALRNVSRPLLGDDTYSRATIRALHVFCAFPIDGGARHYAT